MTSPLIEIRDATVYRGDTRVFHEFNLTVDRNENVAVLGPNGAGKSTLVRLLTRDVYPVWQPQPPVRILGKSQWNVWELRKHLGFISHDLHATYRKEATGREVVLSGFWSAVGLTRHHQPTDAMYAVTRRWMETLGIDHLADRSFGALSTGEQRRFLLARALVHEPEALVLDEPTSGLDLAATVTYLDTLRALLQQGKSVLLVTHHLQEIPPEIQRVVLLDRGNVVADGDKRTLLNDEELSRLYGVPLRVLESGGYYQVLPA